jgi:hypothetical protein
MLVPSKSINMEYVYQHIVAITESETLFDYEKDRLRCILDAVDEQITLQIVTEYLNDAPLTIISTKIGGLLHKLRLKWSFDDPSDRFYTIVNIIIRLNVGTG